MHSLRCCPTAPTRTTATRPDDEALLRAAQQAIEALNRSHPSGADDTTRFLLLHRPRQWSETEQRWIGWERKRGKLEQLIRWLVEGLRTGRPARSSTWARCRARAPGCAASSRSTATPACRRGGCVNWCRLPRIR